MILIVLLLVSFATY
nr:hypothetical protein [Escherichia coli]